MSNSKIEISVGNFKFSGEGDQKWLSEQLVKILNEAEKLIKLVPMNQGFNTGLPSQKISNPVLGQITLAKLLKDSGAASNQNKRFLGAAVYLDSKGKSNITTTEVNAALKDAGQIKLRNASECLNQNVKKGFIEKTNKNEFMVTVHGKEEFGIES